MDFEGPHFPCTVFLIQYDGPRASNSLLLALWFISWLITPLPSFTDYQLLELLLIFLLYILSHSDHSHSTTLSLIYSLLYITSHWLCGLEIFLSLREVVNCPVCVWGSELFLGLLLELLSQICDTLHIWISNMTYLKWLVIWLILSVAKEFYIFHYS